MLASVFCIASAFLWCDAHLPDLQAMSRFRKFCPPHPQISACYNISQQCSARYTTKHSAPQQGQGLKQGVSPRSNRSGQGTQSSRGAAARYQGYFLSQSQTSSSEVSGHLYHGSLRQSPSKGTKTNLCNIPLQHASRQSQRHSCHDSLNLSQFHHFCTTIAAVLRQVSE